MSSSVRTNGQGLVPRTRRQHRQQRVVQAAVTVAAAMGLAATSASRAADVHWNVADGNWATPENWAPLPGDPPPPPTVPGATDRAVLDFAGGGTAHVTTDVADILTLQVTAGNTLSIEPGGIVTALIGGTLTGEPPVPVNDALQAVRIGDGGIGAVVINDGTLQNPYTNAGSNNGADIYIGVGTGGAGTLTQTGALSQVTARDLRVGSDGATGTLTVSGGTIATNFTILGRVGGTANATLSGGTISAVGQFNLGAGGGGLDGTGSLTQTGGTVSAAFVAVGRGGTNTGTARGLGTFTLDQGLVDANFSAGGTTNGHVVVGMNGGRGTMTMNGGTITTDGGLYVAYNDGGNVNNRSEGNLTLHGGTATVGGIFAVGYAAASGTMTMDGGTINVTGMSGVGFDDRTNNSRATLTTGTFAQTGGTINAAGGFTVANGSATGTYSLGQNAVLNIGPAASADLLVGGNDQVTVAHTMLGTLTIADNAAVTVGGQLRMGQTGGDAVVTLTGGTLSVTGNSLVAQSGTTVATVPNPGVATLNINGGSASFAGNLTAGDTANTDGTISVTAGSLSVTGALVAGRNSTLSGVITQSGGTVTAGSLGIRTGTGTVGDVNLTGGTFTAGATTNNNTLDVSGTAVASLGPVGGTGALTVADTATVNAQHVRQAAVTMTGGTVAIAASGGAATGTSVIPALALSGPAKFDLNDGKLVTNNPVGTATTPSGNGRLYDGLQGLVQSAKNGDAWNGPGLTSSKAATEGGLTTIGVANGAQAKGGIGETETALWGGQTITGSSILAMYTYAGDANLDGAITGDDYSAIDFGILFPGMDGYANGDFNYDGFVTGDDYSVIDLNILLQGPQIPTGGSVESASASAAALSGVTAVPEPSACGFALLGAAAALRRRRRCTR